MVKGPFAPVPAIADTSAWVRSGAESVRGAWLAAVETGDILTTPPVALEVLYGAVDRAGLDARERDLMSMRSVPITESVGRAALGAMRDLAEVQPGFHRIPPLDYLVAAAAQEAGVDVLHYDHHFDRLAEVLHFDSRWVAPPGSL